MGGPVKYINWVYCPSHYQSMYERPKGASPVARGEAARAGTQNEKPMKARPEPTKSARARL